MYKLFVGFRKLGKFRSIRKAKRYARDSGLYGVFNLLKATATAGTYAVGNAERKKETGLETIMNNPPRAAGNQPLEIKTGSL